MSNTEKFALPFKWREFGSWFSALSSKSSQNGYGSIKISDVFFESGNRRLDGIRIKIELDLKKGLDQHLFLCAFIADMEGLRLFEPYMGYRENEIENYVCGKKFGPFPEGGYSVTDLFIPEQGWVLPSIWKHLFSAMGLKAKAPVKMPEVVVFGFLPGARQPLFYCSQVFDYFGQAKRLREQLVLSDFFNLIGVSNGSTEKEISQAYLERYGELSRSSAGPFSHSIEKLRESRIKKIKEGYQIWLEKKATA